MQSGWIVLNSKADVCPTAFALSGFAKEIPPQQADLIMKRNFQGVYTEKNYKRFYPQPQANAQIIGLTNSEGIGVEGLEMQLNKQLAGIDGEQKVIRDKRGNRLKSPKLFERVSRAKILP